MTFVGGEQPMAPGVQEALMIVTVSVRPPDEDEDEYMNTHEGYKAVYFAKSLVSIHQIIFFQRAK